MLMKFIMFINLTISLTLTMMKSPLTSNLVILTQSITLTLMLNLINKSSWISFMLFILYVGGLMIIFLYISSIAFNEINFIKNYKNLIYKIIILLMMFFIIKSFIIMENFKFNNLMNFEDNFYLINMFIMPNNLMIYFILFILFFMLISIIWLLKNNKGPIRQKN
uniref:NADH dehydrogenase subunit 6 n=1 Tax=Phyllaphis fagi TaxID=935663 RepID=A0A1L1YMB5_9HEMI|nr:NADH dehydrogenase subunit 6 [Phyllaphis fagi]